MSSLPNANVDHSKRHPGHVENLTHQRPAMTTTSEEYAHEIYRCASDDEYIEAFLCQNDAFDARNRRWMIPQSSTKEGLFSSVYTIVWSVVGRFVKPTQPGVTRTAESLRVDSMGEGNDNAGGSTRSFIAIQASGPSFESPVPLAEVPAGSRCSFSNVASCIAVKLDSEMEGVKETVQEIEPYARRIFEEQPNRLFVRSLIVTEKRVQLIHFDRAGVEVTPFIDIHQHPATLVRIVAGLATTDERLLGLDTSIQWTIVNDMKERGTLTTTGPGGDTVTYPILEHIPIPREGITGKGTNCWRLQDPDTLEELVVKDCWRPDYLLPEYDLLELIKGLPGVVQMVSYETGRGETKDFRCPSTAGKAHNRVAMRTTMKSYGKSIDFFTSVVELLCAIRDAIAGHQRLLGDGLRILHRDISHNNILMGLEGAPAGHRGILIDLDIAFRATDERPIVAIHYNVGTRIFQSLSVLFSYYPRDQPQAHDYLDDLESFFFVLVYTFLVHKPDGSRFSSREIGPSFVGQWDHPDPKTAWSNKESMLGGADDTRVAGIIEDTWPSECVSLYRRFSYWMTEVREEKIMILNRNRKQKRPTATNPLEDFHTHRDDHYAQVLALFDEAIDAAKASASTARPNVNILPGLPAPMAKSPVLPPFILKEPSQPPSPLQAANTHLEPLTTIGIPPPAAPVQSPFIYPRQASSAPNIPPRILKRCLEDSEETDLPSYSTLKVQRIVKKGCRVTACPR